MKRFVLLAALCPLAAEAQSGSGIGVYVSRDASLPNTPNLAGLELRSSQGPLALRISGAAGPVFRSVGVSPAGDERRFVGSADLDLMLDLGGLLGGSGGGGLALMPFVGLGVVGAGVPDSEMESMTAWSYGGSLLMPLGSRVALQLEGRQRIPFADSAASLPQGFGRALEQRVGIVVRFGGSRSSRSSAATRSTAGAWAPAIIVGTGAA
ncbi:MAG TPA: hypothetical protein VMM18_04125, partial [Gemmatimonadaceae bacterium]|nr:hypothetical protein [Gemmatimonadaceae bacterium]